jgi:hypothetical protein
MRNSNRALFVLAAGALCACGEAPGDDEEMGLGALEMGAVGGNAINPNAINPNAINPNAINPNALSPSALSTATMSTSLLTSIKDPGETGALSRQLLRYLVSCAFDPSQSLSFTWVDEGGFLRAEVYWGLLALAPAWAAGPLDEEGQRWVSACIASRTNWYGVPVNISARGAHPAVKQSGIDEKYTYPREEGAFWGNLFAPTPWLKACHFGPNVTRSRELLRDCAAGHLGPNGSIQECGIIGIVGSCDTACDSLDTSNLFHPKCFEDPSAATKVKTTQVITIFLPW